MRRAAADLAFLAVTLYASLAAAHAEEPNSQNVFAVDGGWVLRANVGIVQSNNLTELICEEAFLGGNGWMLGALGPTEWITFGETAIMRTEDGCDFEMVMEIARRPSDATVHVPSGRAAFVMNGADGAGLYLSEDRGHSFDLRQTFDPTMEQTTGARFLDADTLIVSGYSRANDGAGLAWSVDFATGAAAPLVIPDMTTYPYVLAARGGHVLLLGRRGDQTVFWGPPDEVALAELVAPTWPSWATLSEDGLTAWISGTDSGRSVQIGTLVGATATWDAVAAETTAACVEPVGDELFLCGLGRIDDYDVLKVTSAGDVEGVLDFRDFVGTRSDCAEGTEVATVCPLVWQQLAPYFGRDPNAVVDDGGIADAGSDTPDAGSQSDVASNATSHDGCCATAPRPVSTGWLGLLFAGAAIAWRRLRR